MHYLFYFLLSWTIFLVWRSCDAGVTAHTSLTSVRWASETVVVRGGFVFAVFVFVVVLACQFPSVIFPFTCATDNKAPVCVLIKKLNGF